MRARFLRVVSTIFFSIFSVAVPALAQYSIRNIEIHGAAPYTEAAILTVSGLQPGQRMSHDSLANAAQHLLDTGVFADAAIELTGTGLSRTVQIELKPLPESALVPATFSNFPWWTSAELDAALRKAVPFYRGGIPPAGNLPDSVDAALTSMLAAKGVQATVTNGSVAQTNAHPDATWDFHIESPAVRVGAVHLRGALPSGAVAAMQRVVNRSAGMRFDENADGLAYMLVAPLQDVGYVDAELTDVRWTVSAAGSGYSVDYTGTIVAGDVFHVANVAWQPTTIYGQDAFIHDATLHSGDVASEDALLRTEAAIVMAYQHLGYLDAYVDAHPQKDAAAHTVSYALSVTPGEIYHLKSVTPVNLSAAAQQDFDRGWLLKPGAVYDPLYTAKFLTSNTALRNLAGYRASFQAAADSQTHLVDLTINFVRAGGQ
jgi:outer membrane protein insertion porin family